MLRFLNKIGKLKKLKKSENLKISIFGFFFIFSIFDYFRFYDNEISGNLKSPTQNRNHERAKKYAHPKAPPNADIIFSAGGRRK